MLEKESTLITSSSLVVSTCERTVGVFPAMSQLKSCDLLSREC
jgi:hypothetical protein